MQINVYFVSFRPCIFSLSVICQLCQLSAQFILNSDYCQKQLTGLFKWAFCGFCQKCIDLCHKHPGLIRTDRVCIKATSSSRAKRHILRKLSSKVPLFEEYEGDV